MGATAVLRSVALLRESNSYEAFDWIVGYADSELDREVNPEAQGRIVELLESETGVAREQNPRGSEHRTPADDAFKLGRLLEARGDVEGAVRAYRRVIATAEQASGDAALAGRASFQLGKVLLERGDPGARDALERALRSPTPAS